MDRMDRRRTKERKQTIVKEFIIEPTYR